jgi:3-oxoacyl-[acyl-carrier protein] reductase
MLNRPVALITGVSRKIGIGYAIALKLAENGWDVALTCFRPYDESQSWGSSDNDLDDLKIELESLGARVFMIEADLSQVNMPKDIFETVNSEMGNVQALVISHCRSFDSSIENTTVEEFGLHFSVNTRSVWLLIREFAKQFDANYGDGRIIALTSDAVAHNLAYGASKGAMDRIVLAAAEEFRDLGITANVINPGPTDTGWINDALRVEILKSTFLNRIGMPEDCANLVNFLCSKEGGWINGQLIESNGGLKK